jgi:CRISPR/Cas system CSM-associated protein Csm3 (group 7 of RAMP superfamily)
MQRHEFTITLTVRAPVLCAGLGQPAFGVDAEFIRNEQGAPIIPRDHIKGQVRDALCTLAREKDCEFTHEDIIRWLGAPSENGNEPRSGQLIFDDLLLVSTHDEPDFYYPRVQINEKTGAADEGMLAFFEQIAPPGAELTFEGNLTAFVDDAEKLKTALNKALKLIPAIGAMKSAGFGEVVSAKVEKSLDARLAIAGENIPDSITFDVIFDRPVLFDAVHEADNLVVGQPIIPGAAIKGALAWLLQRMGENPAKNEALSKMLVSHAFPLDRNGQRELEHPIPLCMASYLAGDKKFAFRCHLGVNDEDLLLNGDLPTYAPDWKNAAFEAARKVLGYPPEERIRRLQRTRVDITYETGTATDQALFTEVALSECIDGSAGHKRRWRFTIHRNDTDQEEFKRLAGLIRQGLWNMGRTNAAMQVVDVRKAPACTPKPFDGAEDTFAIMLLTPAVMTDALKACNGSLQWHTEAKDAYAAYWQERDVELVDFMASQRWAGRYAAMRFRPYRGRERDRDYYPFMLTEPGSVFLLKGEGLKEKLATCHLPHAELNEKAVSWRTSPFVPENGYGRFRFITKAEMEGEGSHA